MGKYFFLAATLAAILLWRADAAAAFWVAVIVASCNFWSLGILHNFKDDPYMPPAAQIAGVVNILTSIAAIGMLIYALFLL